MTTKPPSGSGLLAVRTDDVQGRDDDGIEDAMSDYIGDAGPSAGGKITVRAAFRVGKDGRKAETGLFAIDPATSACLVSGGLAYRYGGHESPGGRRGVEGTVSSCTVSSRGAPARLP